MFNIARLFHGVSVAASTPTPVINPLEEELRKELSPEDFKHWQERMELGNLDVPVGNYLQTYLHGEDWRIVAEFKDGLLEHFRQYGGGIQPHLLAVGSSTHPRHDSSVTGNYGDVDIVLLSDNIEDTETRKGSICDLAAVAKQFLDRKYPEKDYEWSGMEPRATGRFIPYERPNVLIQTDGTPIHLLVEFYFDNSKNRTFGAKLAEERRYNQPHCILNPTSLTI